MCLFAISSFPPFSETVFYRLSVCILPFQQLPNTPPPTIVRTTSLSLSNSIMTLLHYSLALGLAHLSVFNVAAQPQPCGGSAFAKVGNKFYIQGGATSGDNLLASLWALDLTTSWSTSQPAWSSLALGPFNAYHSAGYTSDGSSFITFGRDTAADPQVIPQSWVNVYDIATNAWTFSSNPANMNDTSRRDFAAVTNPSANKVYALGGDAGPSGSIWSNMFSIYDTTSRTLTESPTPAPGPQSISTYAAVWVPRLSSMLVIGGALQNGSPPGLYVYRPDTGAWSIQVSKKSVKNTVCRNIRAHHSHRNCFMFRRLLGLLHTQESRIVQLAVSIHLYQHFAGRETFFSVLHSYLFISLRC